MVFIYAGMIFGYQSYLDRKIQDLDKQVVDLNKQIESDQAKALITLYSQVVNLKNLLKNHLRSSGILTLLEQNIDSGVYYVGATFDARSNDLKLDGVASDYNALVRQIEVFRSNPNVRDIFLDEASKKDQVNVQFSLSLILAPSLLSQ